MSLTTGWNNAAIGFNLTVGSQGGLLTLAQSGTSISTIATGNIALTDNATLVITAPAGTYLTLGVNFSGQGNLVIYGGGSVVLAGTNTLNGSITVQSAHLGLIGGSGGTAPIYVGEDAILYGSGKYSNQVVVGNGGIFKPGFSPGYMSLVSATINSGGTYQQDIAGTRQASASSPDGSSGYYSFLSLTSGQFQINSGAILRPQLSNLFSAGEPGYGSSIYIPTLGDRFRMVTASGGISGRFTTIAQPAELTNNTQFIALYNVNNSNSIDLAVAPTSYGTTLSFATTNAKSVASVLDQLLGVNKAGTSSSAQDSLLYAVAGQTAASLPGFAQALSGELHAASVATLPQATQRLQQAVLARLGDYPMAPSQLNPALNNALLTGGISATNTSGLPTASMSTNPAVNPNAVNIVNAAIADGRAWGEIAYQRGDRSSNSAGNGYNNNLYQVVLGADAYSNVELGLKLGAGLTLSNTTVAASNGNSTIQQGALFIYGKMPVLQDYVLDGMVSVGLSSTNLSRNDPTGFTGGFNNKAVMGNDSLVSVGVSRAFEYNDLRVTPYARLTYQYVGQSAYDEGSGAAGLSISRFSGNAVRGAIGVAAGSLNKDPLKDQYTYRANLAVGADTTGLLNPTLSTTLGGYSSSVTTATAGSTFVQVGLYGTVKLADNAYAYAGISGEARAGQTLYGGSVGLRMAF